MSDQNHGGSAGELRGRIKWFNPEKVFGFFPPADGAPDVFLHISALKDAGLQDAPEGATIHCEVGQGRKGVQVMRVLTLDISSATPRRPAPAGGGLRDRGPRGPETRGPD